MCKAPNSPASRRDATQSPMLVVQKAGDPLKNNAPQLPMGGVGQGVVCDACLVNEQLADSGVLTGKADADYIGSCC